MIDNVDDYYAAIGDVDGDDGGENRKITNQQRMDWNAYLGWLEKRGMKGNPTLDKNNLGKNLLAKYIKENPNTSLSLDLVIPIQKDFSNYRQWSIDQIKQGKGAFAEGVNEDNYLKHLSIVDGYPGQFTTRNAFPLEYLKTFEDGNLVSTENKGFATVK